jgi:hypothetical protein
MPVKIQSLKAGEVPAKQAGRDGESSRVGLSREPLPLFFREESGLKTHGRIE